MTERVTGDPFEAVFPRIYEKGLFARVSAARAENAADQEAQRQAIVAGRPNPFAPPARSRADLLRDLAAERAEAEAFVAKADRVLGVSAPSRSADVDDDATEGEWPVAEPWLASEDEAA